MEKEDMKEKKNSKRKNYRALRKMLKYIYKKGFLDDETSMRLIGILRAAINKGNGWFT